jgi:Putative beta barrel porin-7 (BBP7)
MLNLVGFVKIGKEPHKARRLSVKFRIFLFTSIALAGVGPAFAQQPGVPPSMTAPPTVALPGQPMGSFSGNADGSDGRMWGGGEYFLWWLKSSQTSPLVVTGTPGASAGFTTPTTPIPTSPGFIGLFTTGTTPAPVSLGTANSVLFGTNVNKDPREGGRFTFGSWLDADRTFGVEGVFLYMPAQVSQYHNSSSGTPALSIPFFNTTTGREDGYPIASGPVISSKTTFVNTTPDVFVGLFTTTTVDSYVGSVAVKSTTELQGGELNSILRVAKTSDLRFDLLVGARWLELDERLQISSAVNDTHSETTVYRPELGLPAGFSPVLNSPVINVARLDDFATHNSFYGGQIGARGEYTWDKWSLSAGVKGGLGIMKETVDVAGATGVTQANYFTPTQQAFLAGIPIIVGTGAPTVTGTAKYSLPGGLFAQPSNIGRYTHDSLAAIGEGNIAIGYKLTESVKATVGYDFLYVSNVVRPGEQIDRGINPTQLILQSPTTPAYPPRPVFQMRETDFWAQGLTLGLEVKY